LVEEGKFRGKEFSFKTLSGSIVQGIIYAEIIEQRSEKYTLLKIIDITEHKQDEDFIHKSETKLRSILDATPFPVALVDLQDNKIHYWSHSALILFGLTAPTAEVWYQIAYPDPDYRQKVIEQWKTALENAKRMLNVINDIVNISKIESGQMEVSISATKVNDQIEFINSFFKPESERNGLKLFVKNILPSKEPIIKTDREKLYAILNNLVNNAIKYTQAGSIEIGCEKKSGFLEFFVKDTGQGVTRQQKEIIFERFRQGTDLTARFNEGAGLGLSISKAFVEMLGGKIWLESEPGVGSTFYFTMPYNIPSEFKPDLNEVPEGTGVEAVETCRTSSDIDLVLMDIRIPVMDGYEATRQIRQFNKKVVIIAQTAYGLAGDREKAIAAGYNDYISKPIHINVLKKLIRKHFH